MIDSDDLSPEQASVLLVEATDQRDAEVALMAVAGGADPNFTDSNGIPALVAAVAQEMSPQVVTSLLNAGADVNAKITGKWSEVRGFTALHVAAAKGNDDIVAVLLEGEAAIDPVSDGAMGSSKATPLMLAANKGHAAVVRTLISAGADVKLNVSSVTALKVTKKEDIRRMLRDAQKRRD